jgi:hypothetical protein
MYPEDVIKEYSKELEELGYNKDDCFTTSDMLCLIADRCETLRKEKVLIKRIEELERKVSDIQETFNLKI